MSDAAFRGRSAVITGASAGIGLATARMLAATGARVINVDLREPTEEIEGCRWCRADVSDYDDVARCVEEILAAEQRVFALVNNAGVARDATVWKMTERQWDEVLDVNLKGAFNMIHHLAPQFRQPGPGRIVNVSSINGLRGKFGLANYAAAKAGLIGLTKTVAKELGRYEVTVNAVAPGLVLTELTRDLPARFLDEARGETLLGRLAEPLDVARVILFLCSDAARHVTGEVIKVDGGQYV